MPYRARALAVVLTLTASLVISLMPGAGPTPAAAATQKVAIIVGPTEITDSNYMPSAEHLADVAVAAGATVELAYCATPAEAKAAVSGANVIVYFGHGNGFPNPYTTPANTTDPSKKLTDRVNGWGLRHPTKPWDGKSCEDDVLQYYGEDHLTGKLSTNGWGSGGIQPAADFVMVMSNACYAPGAGEARPAPSEALALARVANYSAPFLALGGTYFATDMGSDRMVDLILRNPGTAFGSLFEMGNGYDASALRRFPHSFVTGAETWIQRTDNRWLGTDYWFAFAGNPARTPSGATVDYAGPVPASPFNDTVGSPFYNDIMWLVDAGITSGCGNGKFCPRSAVTREQMASFLVRGLKLPATSTDFFSDDDSSGHRADINALAASKITGGCAEGRFCPSRIVTREQMASFLVRALDLPTTSVDYFADDAGSPHEADINRLAASGITGGCGTASFCPSASINREQMAAFLHRAIGK